jgi:hypothetical protein
MLVHAPVFQMVQKQKGTQQGRSDFFSHPPFHCSTFGHVGVNFFYEFRIVGEFEFKLFQWLHQQKKRLRRKT